MQHHDRGQAPPAHDLQHVVLGADVEVVGGLVHEQQAGLLGEGARDEHALLLPAGEQPELAPREGQGAGAVQGLGRDPLVLLRGRAEGAGMGDPAQQHDVRRGERHLPGELLGHHRDPSGAFPAGELAQVTALEAHLARIGHEGAVQDPQRGGLAAAVRSHQAEDLARAHGHVHAVEHLPCAEGMAQTARLQQRHAPQPSRASSHSWILSSPSTTSGEAGSAKLNSSGRSAPCWTARRLAS